MNELKEWQGVSLAGIDFTYPHKTQCPKCASEGGDRSGDNLHVYGLDDDGRSLGGWCFKCNWGIPSEEFLAEIGKDSVTSVCFSGNFDKKGESMISKRDEEKLKEKSLTPEQLAEIYEKTSDTLTTKYRGLDGNVAKELGVRWEYNTDGSLKAMYFPAYVKDNGEMKVTGYKVRDLPKNFHSFGYVGKCNLMGGMTDTIADTVILCGGENDMLTIKQELGKTITRSFNVVTSLLGESSTADMIRQYISYFEKHKKIILALDNDASGKEAQQACIDLLPKDKVYIANLRYKDANDYLKNREDAKTFAQDYYWNVSPVEDFGIIGSGSLFEYGLEAANDEGVDIPFHMADLKPYIPKFLFDSIVLIVGSTSIGKCHGKGQKILMSDLSVKNVEDIVVGDTVLGKDGSLRTVNYVHNGVDEIYKITPSRCGDSYTTNSKHLLHLKVVGKPLKSFGIMSINETINISVEDFIKIPKWYRDRHLVSVHGLFNQEASNYNYGYLLGLWLADGNKDSSKITIDGRDNDMLSILESETNKLGFKISSNYQKQGSNATTYYISNGMRELLSDVGVMGNKHIPKFLLESDYETRLSILAGFLDGDGYLAKTSFDLTLKDDKLASDVVFLARSLGFLVSISDKFSKCQDFEGGIYKRINIGGDISSIPTKLPRKIAKNVIKKYSNNGVTLRVESVGMGEYYGFGVDGDNLYCLPDLQVTHNTANLDTTMTSIIMSTHEKVGVLSLEASRKKFAQKMASRIIGVPLNRLPKEEQIELQNKYRDKIDNFYYDENGEHRFFFADSDFDSIEEAEKCILRLIKIYGCRIIIGDPIQNIIGNKSNEEQRSFMLFCEKIKKKYGALILFGTHTRKSTSGSKGGSDGAVQKEDDIEGSGSIAKSASLIITLSRNKNAEDLIEKNTTYYSIPKNRDFEMTGELVAKSFYRNSCSRLYPFSYAEKHNFFQDDKIGEVIEDDLGFYITAQEFEDIQDNSEVHEEYQSFSSVDADKLNEKGVDDIELPDW